MARDFFNSMEQMLKERLLLLEGCFEADVVFYYGEIHPALERLFRDVIEMLKEGQEPKNRLALLLNTPGGMVETAEKIVKIIRRHYDEVYIIVPDFAMSAGTILCMSADKIFMDYSSSLGPIDPQIIKGETYVPAQGYLDQYQKMLDKSGRGELTPAEYFVLQQTDLGMLARFEQAKELSIQLLKEWLVQYKFKNWAIHRTDPQKRGQAVSQAEKEQRADEIAKKLAQHENWHSHARMIGIDTLTKDLRLEIEDYSQPPERRKLVRSYNDLLT